MKELLTHSRMQAFKTCRKMHAYSYEMGLRRIDDARALRMGSAFHDGVEHLGKGAGIDVACAAVRKRYENMPEAFDTLEWAYECETILRLVCAYDWRWKEEKIVNVETEFAFALPLINPETGRPTPTFNLAGKIDGIVRLEDGRLAIKETKTMSDDLGPDSPLWRRMRMDHQVSLYIDAARRLGYAVDTVLYDCVRKPSIAPTSIPITDADGLKIVLDADGLRVRNTTNKSWRQTADKDKGYVLQTRAMTPDEWGEKLSNDIFERPEFYFARVEVPRLDQDVAEYQAEIWEIQKTLREAQLTGHHFRTVNKNTCSWCSYFDLCSTNQKINPASPPVGFEFVKDAHPELGDKNVLRTTDPAANEASAAATEAVA